MNLAPELKEYNDIFLKPIGISAKNREEWIIFDAANCLYGFTSIPFYESITPEIASFVFNNANFTTILIAKQFVSVLTKMVDLGSLLNIVLLDKIDSE